MLLKSKPIARNLIVAGLTIALVILIRHIVLEARLLQMRFVYGYEGEIFATSASGSVTLQLTHGTISEQRLRQERWLNQLSSDLYGTFLATPSSRLAQWFVERRPDEFNSSSPSWSPDGEYIAYLSCPEVVFGCEITFSRLDGSDVKTLTCGCMYPQSRPIWSPDGNRIAAIGLYNGEDGSLLSHLTIFDVYSDAITVLPNLPGHYIDAFGWAADGTEIVYSARRVPLDAEVEQSGWEDWSEFGTATPPQVYDLFLVRTDGQYNPVNVTQNGYSLQEYESVWSPDGQMIATAARVYTQEQKDNHNDIFIISVTELTFYNITNTPDLSEYDISWSADGNYVYYNLRHEEEYQPLRIRWDGNDRSVLIPDMSVQGAVSER